MAVSSLKMSSCVTVLGWFLLVLLASSSPSGCAAEVVTLTEQTFEHQTQASTGMTTGSWLVMFSVPDCPSCESLKPVLDDLGKDEEIHEKGIVLGSVDCSKQQGICGRFSTHKLPALLYLHKKQLYKFPRDEEFGNLPTPTVEELKSFVMAPSVAGEPIPDPPSALDAILQPLLLIHKHNPWAGYAIFTMTGIIVFTILLLVVALITGGGSGDSKVKKGKTKTKSSKKNK